jgi:hypothetical protein
LNFSNDVQDWPGSDLKNFTNFADFFPLEIGLNRKLVRGESIRRPGSDRTFVGPEGNCLAGLGPEKVARAGLFSAKFPIPAREHH